MTKSDVATIERPATLAEQSSKSPSFNEQLGQRKSQFQAVLPAHIPVERFMRVVMTAVQNNPSLAHADRASLWTSSAKAATDGLLPDGREGALVIYKTKAAEKGPGGRDVWIEKVQWMPMIAGIRKKVRNSGEIATWDAQVVHAKDQFEYELGDDPFIKHKPFMEGDPGPVIAAYSVATLKSGEKSREVMTRSQLDKVRSASKSKDRGPWVDWFEEMCRKSVARRHAKVLPMSTDLDDLIRRDDDLYDMRGAREEARAANGDRPQSLAGRLDMLAQMPEPQADRSDDNAGAAIEATKTEAGESSPEAVRVNAAPERVSSVDEDPAKAALVKKLAVKAAKGTKALRLGMAGLSDAEQALLDDEDHELLGAAAEEADQEKAEA